MAAPTEPGQQQQQQQRPSWYQEHIGPEEVSDDAQRLLHEYSGLQPDQVLPHIRAIRDKGFDIAPYPCIGQVKFLNYKMPNIPYFPTLVERLHSGARLLDVGCGFAQEIRYLAQFEKIPSSQLFGFDLEQAFIDLSYDLFRDRDKLQATLFAANLMDEPLPESLARLHQTVDIVQVAQVLHVFDWDDQVKAAKRLVDFTRPDSPSMIAGHQMGSSNAGSYPLPGMNIGKGTNYRHNRESMRRFWDEVGRETDSRWSLDFAEIPSRAIAQNKDAAWAKVDPGMNMIYFCATRQP